MTKRPLDNLPRTRRAVIGSVTAAGLTAALGCYADASTGDSPRIATRDRAALARNVKGDVYWRGDESYEDARGLAVWRANKPPRYPAVVVRAESDADVVNAVRFAREHGLQVGTRSGGHGWSSAHVRDGAMLIDLSEMQEVEVDPQTRTVWTRPSVWGSAVNQHLGRHGLVTPTAHHVDVGIGGFVLCGGFGWNSRLWGNGSEHLLAADVVTAEGKLIRVDEQRNADYLWAARGAGPGFFGVVTRMKLKAHPMPRVWKISVHSYPLDVLEELFTWARSIVEEVPPYIEMFITTSAADASGNWAEQRLTVIALAITDDDSLADAGLAILDTCPVVGKAIIRRNKVTTDLTERYAAVTAADPPGYRYACDNLYTNAPAATLVPKLHGLFTGLPTPRTHVYWLNWGPQRKWPDMALSMQADIYIGAYTVWDNPADDERLERWPVEQLGKVAALSVGGQLNDENMLRNPQPYFSAAAERKLDSLRRKYDPGRRFVSFLKS